MTAPTLFLDGRVALYAGDCIDVLARLPADSIDSAVMDPPYHLTSIVRRFGAEDAVAAKPGATGVYGRGAAGFMGKRWDGGDIAFRPETWAAVLRVLKPGAYLAAFASTRGFSRMGVAIEDAGFVVHPLITYFCAAPEGKAFLDTLSPDQMDAFARLLTHAELGPMLAWTFGQGFPKATRLSSCALDGPFARVDVDGFRYGGQALKPAIEPIFLAQKPFSEDSGTANVHRWGTGALNIDGCRVGDDVRVHTLRDIRRMHNGSYANGGSGAIVEEREYVGRWPANIVHDGSDEVLAGFPDQAGAGGAASGPSLRGRNSSVVRGVFNGLPEGAAPAFHADSGSASRFFYSAKADADDRLGSGHPTVKPVDLMQWLVRLVTPPGGTVLDCFAGTGTTGAAAWREGFRAVLIEREPEHLDDIARRLALETEGSGTRRRESAKAKAAREGKPADFGPLFGGLETPLLPEQESAE